MPEVVSCPKCQRKSRVPDTLVGKKVKCPGCAEIFTADVNGPAAPKKEEAARKKRDDDEGGDTYEVVDDRKKKRRRDDDDEDDERVSDKPVSRRRAAEDDDEDDKPRKSRTSRADDDDDRVTTRRRRFSRDDDDDDDDDDEVRGGPPKRALEADWSRIRMGLSLLLASVLTTIGVIIFLIVGMCCVGAGMMGAMGNAGAGGRPPGAGAIAGLGAGALIVMGVYLLGLFASWAMKVGGSIMCLPSPPAFGSKMLALVGLILIGVESLLSVLQFVINIASHGMAGMAAGAGNPMMGGMAPAAGAGAAAGQMVLGLLAGATGLAYLFVIGFYIRSLGLCLRNYSLAGTAKGWLITLGITLVLGVLMIIVGVATVGLVGFNVANQMGAAQAGKPQGAGAAGGAMAGAGVVLCGLGGIILIMMLVLLIWYIIMLAQARGSITGRMTR